VLEFDSTGNPLGDWGKPGDGEGEFRDAWGLGVDAVGDIYVSDHDTCRVQKFSYPAPVTATSWARVKAAWR
jgi:hypothetical protein